jgi:hypothetical protein
MQQRNGKKMKAASKQVSLFLHNVEQAPNHVLVNGKKAVFSWNPESKLLTAQVRANAKSTNLIRVNW